jgi:hypothetical protein
MVIQEKTIYQIDFKLQGYVLISVHNSSIYYDIYKISKNGHDEFGNVSYSKVETIVRRIKFDPPNPVAFNAMTGISYGEIRGETAKNMLYTYILQNEIMNEDESWVKKHFPENWKYHYNDELKSRERKTSEVIDS